MRSGYPSVLAVQKRIAGGRLGGEDSMRVRSCFAIAMLALISIPTSVIAVEDRHASRDRGPEADHLGGSFTICGELLEYVAPTALTEGSLEVSGVAFPDPHPFPVAAGTVVAPALDAQLTALAAGDHFTCLALVGDGMAVITSIAIASVAEICGPMQFKSGGSVRIVDETSADRFATLTGEAQALVAADPDLAALVAQAAEGSDQTCLSFATDGAGEIASVVFNGRVFACGSAIDLEPDPASPSILFSYDGSGNPVPDTQFQMDRVVIDSSLVPVEAVALLEMDAWASSDTGFARQAGACLELLVADNALDQVALLISSQLCGETRIDGENAFIEEPGSADPHLALMHDLLIGADVGSPQTNNVLKVIQLGQQRPMCFSPNLGWLTGAAIEVSGSAHVSLCATVTRSGDAVTVTPTDGGAPVVFDVSSEFSSMTNVFPGVVMALRVDAGINSGFAVQIFGTGGTCAPALLPDTASATASRESRDAGEAAFLVTGLFAGLATVLVRQRRSAVRN